MSPHILGACVATALIASLNWSTEPPLDDLYPVTRYEKCMVLHGDTVSENICDKEKQSEY